MVKTFKAAVVYTVVVHDPENDLYKFVTTDKPDKFMSLLRYRHAEAEALFIGSAEACFKIRDQYQTRTTTNKGLNGWLRLTIDEVLQLYKEYSLKLYDCHKTV